MNDIKKGIQYAFQTENNMTIAMSGSGHAAMECAVFNVVEPGESVLIAINGIWGERVAEIAERMGRVLLRMALRIAFSLLIRLCPPRFTKTVLTTFYFKIMFFTALFNY